MCDFINVLWDLKWLMRFDYVFMWKIVLLSYCCWIFLSCGIIDCDFMIVILVSKLRLNGLCMSWWC